MDRKTRRGSEKGRLQGVRWTWTKPRRKCRVSARQLKRKQQWQWKDGHTKRDKMGLKSHPSDSSRTPPSCKFKNAKEE